MLIIPAIDIKDGKCVRLRQGDFNSETVYSNDPVLVAKQWEAKGALALHIVDLDGAKNGRIVNLNLIREIRRAIQIPIQVGGGVRSKEVFKNLVAIGANRVVLGTMALENRNLLSNILSRYSNQVVVSLDNKNGNLAKKGWQENTDREVVGTAQDLEQLGIKRFIYTNIAKDGTLTEPDYQGVKSLVRSIRAKIIVAGGISSIADIRKLKSFNLEGVIIGKALYEGKINLMEAMDVS